MGARREDAGYERLLDGSESSGAYSPPIAAGRLALPLGDGGSKGSTAITVQATAAGAPAPQPGAPGVQGGAGAAHNAGVDSQLEEAPSALSEWEEAEGQLFVWLGMSIATLFLSVLALSFGTIAAVCGIGGACTRVSWCRRGGLADEVKTTHVLAMLTAALAAVMCLVSLSWSASISRLCGDSSEEWGQSEDVCGQLAELYFFYTIWFGVYAGLSAAVARRAAGVRRLLNPVTSGMVV